MLIMEQYVSGERSIYKQELAATSQMRGHRRHDIDPGLMDTEKWSLMKW
jgi:hypothetical protein